MIGIWRRRQKSSLNIYNLWICAYIGTSLRNSAYWVHFDKKTMAYSQGPLSVCPSFESCYIERQRILYLFWLIQLNNYYMCLGYFSKPAFMLTIATTISPVHCQSWELWERLFLGAVQLKWVSQLRLIFSSNHLRWVASACKTSACCCQQIPKESLLNFNP